MIQRQTLIQWLTISVFMLSVPLASCNEAEAANDKGLLYEVTKTEPMGSPMLIEVEDTFRLVFKAKDRRVELKPLPPLRGRWGHKNMYSAELYANEVNKALYCGYFTTRNSQHPSGKGHEDSGEEEMSHPISISVVAPDYVILNFDECAWHDSHGGLAHAHSND
jgi:hypothetical protein